MRAKKKVAVRWAMPQDHQIQLPLMPPSATIPVTARGVSAAKVVARMEVPASHQGNLRSPTKKLPTPVEARRV